MRPNRHLRILALLCLLVAGLAPALLRAQTAVAEQSRDDAWWTGPMLANSAETLPPGHFLLEPYLYDVSSKRSDSFGSRTYMIYGLADRLSVGMIPTFGYNHVAGGPNSSGIGTGDFTVQAQYRFTEFQEGSWLPTTAVMLQETLPTGRYDRLGNRPADGLGSGAYTTTLAFNAQTYLWMPNGRILRMRLNLSQSFSGRADVEGTSVYGTSDDFRGNARPGSNFYADVAWEYSVTRRWVLALDLTYSRTRSTRVRGYDTADPLGLPGPVAVRSNSGSSVAFGFAPAIEYNWTPNLGVLIGTRVILGGHRTTGSITPAVALNYVH